MNNDAKDSAAVVLISSSAEIKVSEDAFVPVKAGFPAPPTATVALALELALPTDVVVPLLVLLPIP